MLIRQHAQPGHMVAVLMGNQNRIQPAGIFSGSPKAAA